jgi:hypothetical protein
MTISTELRKAGPFTGNGVTTAFPFSFKVFAATDVIATRADTLGAETGLVLNTDFTVALNADQDAAPGGTVTLAAPLSTGYRLVVSSAVPNLQPTDITNNGGFYPRVIEDALDRHVAQIQQIDEKVDRALKVAVTSPLGDQALPSPVAGMLIGWNESNDGLKNYAPIGGTLLGQQLAAANGSSLVGFQQAGSGAVVRTAQDKMREWVSVKDFGAVGDGVADDTAALANAIAWATSGTRKRTLFFPAGVYVTTAMLDVDKPTAVLVGEGRYNSVIKFTGSGVAVSFTDANPNNGAFTFGGGIEDICIEGNANATSLLYVNYVNHFCVKNVNLREANTVSGVGLHILGTVLGYFENVYCSTNAQLMASRPQNGIVVDRSPTTLSRATANTFIHCVVEGMTGDGIQLVNSDQSAFFGGTSENNNGNGVTIAAGSRMNTFVSTAFENSSGTTFADISDNGFSNRFVNCYSKKLIYIGAASQFSQVEGGFHQRITVTGDFATLQDLKYSFFSAGGTVTTTANTSTRNLFNADTSALTFNTKAPTTPTVTASPYTYTNGSGRDEEVIVSGGTVTQIVFNRGGPIATLPTSGMFRLAPQDKLVISYSSAPTVVVVPFGTNFI